MRKIKLLIASMIGAIALVFTAIFGGANVNAATYSNDNRTSTWANDSRTGILVQTSAPSSGIDYSKAFGDMPSGQVKLQRKIMLIPVPSAAAEGQVSFTADGENNTRFLYLLTYDSTNQAPVYSTNNTKVTYTKEVKTINFTTDNVIPRENNYYVGLATTDDYKIAGKDISVTLTEACGVTYTPTVVKCTVKYDLNGGTYDSKTSIPDEEDIVAGSTINLPDASKISKGDTVFIGWKNTAGDVISSSTTTYKVSASTTLTAIFQYGAVEKGVYTIDPSVVTDLTSLAYFNIVGSEQVFVDQGTIKLNSNGSKTSNNINIVIPANSTADLTVIGKGGSSSGTSKYKVEFDSATEIAFPEKDTTTVISKNFTFVNNTEDEKVLYIYRSSNTVRLSYISVTVRDNSTYDNVELNLLKQFDDDTNPTKLRLIGEIKGVAFDDYSNISSVLISMDFNGNHYEKYCYKLYKSVATIDNSLSGGTDTMYTVLTITGIGDYVGKSKKITNIKMTVNYEDGMTKTVQRTDIAIA